MAKCEKCFLDLAFYQPVAGGLCPNCGQLSSKVHSSAHTFNSDIPPLKKEQTIDDAVELTVSGGLFPFPFIETIKSLLFNPRKVFKQYRKYFFSSTGISSALAFAVVCNWISSLFSFIWKSMFGVFFENHMMDFMRVFSKMSNQDLAMMFNHTLENTRARSFDFLFGAGTIVLSPFFTLVKIVFFAAIIHIGVKIFLKNNKEAPLSYGTTLKILCFGSAASLLNVIPIVGILAAMVMTFVIEFSGIHETYQSTNMRTTFALLFPLILFFVFIFVMFAIAAVIGFSFVSLLGQ